MTNASFTKRQAVVALAAASVLLVGCGSDDATESSETPEAPTSSAPASSATTSQTAETFDLEGTWRAGPVTIEETAATIRRFGLGKWVKNYRENAPFSGNTVLSLTIENGEWDLYGESGGGEPAPIDYDADYEIEGETVVFHHSDGSNTYRWSVDGDSLTLEFVGTTFPVVPGETPEEVYQRALYMTAPFTRQS